MIYKNNICPVCGLACDDIDIEINGSEINVYSACEMGRAKYNKLFSGDRILKPLVNGKETTWEKAIEFAAKILVDAKKPLLFMGTEVSTETMGVGIEMAEYLRGFVDSCSTMCHGPTIIGAQSVGIPTATLGEIKNRADVVIFWGCNPMESHPRLLSRYSVYPRGFFKRQGRKGRKVVVIDTRRTLTADIADLFLQIEPNMDFELMSAIQAIINGYKIDDNVAGIKSEEINELVNIMKNARFGVVFVGLGLASTVGKNRNMEKAMSMVRSMNRFTRFVLLANRGHCNVTGFNEICTWVTGYPYGVDFTRGYPRYNPGETTAVDLLARREIDALLVIASDLVAHYPKSIVKYIAEIPLISIEISHCPTTFLSDVVIPGVMDSMECEGTFYRMDHVPIHVKKFRSPPFEYTDSSEDTMRQIFRKVRGLKKEK
ncbi:MAG: formylmethanofuran dehydrogenase subunit B [Candidatus Altiarchaeales archaeon]|nr:MAG: formylmethanofuran dehydrogenase subunit B [Candidatus Altiarchaeales archaeon]